ncbi:MAG: hypothetical protein WC874_02010 [Candidatus Izemoplasmatales bacterium]|jgi:hypothetical protein
MIKKTKESQYSSSSEKEKVRNFLLFPLFRKIHKIAERSLTILELIDEDLESIRRLKIIDPWCEVIGVTFGDQDLSQNSFCIFEEKLDKLMKDNYFLDSYPTGFDFINLDFYGPGRFFDETKSWRPDLLINVLKMQSKQKAFGLMLTVDSYDDIFPRRNHIIANGKNELDLRKALLPSIMPSIANFASTNNLEANYERLISIAGLVKEVSLIANFSGYSIQPFKKPVVYVGKSSGHITPMISLGFLFLKRKKNLSDKEIIKFTKKAVFLYK